MRKMRPRELLMEASTQPLEAAATAAGAPDCVSGPGMAWGGDFDGFFRGGTPPSLAARPPLEVDPEIRLHDFLRARVVQEDHVIRRGFVERRRQARVYFLVVSRVCGE